MNPVASNTARSDVRMIPLPENAACGRLATRDRRCRRPPVASFAAQIQRRRKVTGRCGLGYKPPCSCRSLWPLFLGSERLGVSAGIRRHGGSTAAVPGWQRRGRGRDTGARGTPRGAAATRISPGRRMVAFDHHDIEARYQSGSEPSSARSMPQRGCHARSPGFRLKVRGRRRRVPGSVLPLRPRGGGLRPAAIPSCSSARTPGPSAQSFASLPS
jgi:hypothetical protein